MITNKGNSSHQSEQDADSNSLDKLSTRETSFPQITTDLKTLNEDLNYRKWLYCLIKDALGKRILEIGSGVGNYTYFFLKHGTVWATDVEDSYVEL